jgi:hypothetical protein
MTHDFTTQARALVAANDPVMYHQPARALLNRTNLGSHHAV